MRPLAAALLLLLTPAAAWPAQPLRPFSGLGVLELAASVGEQPGPLILYQEPGIARLAELGASGLPLLSGAPGEPLVAVSARRGGWSRVTYDEAGREGWLAEARAWRFHPWREFLPGRIVKPLPGLKKTYYALRGGAGEDAAPQGYLTRGQAVRVLKVEDDWALSAEPAGWFRWRDPDGRLTVALP